MPFALADLIVLDLLLRAIDKVATTMLRTWLKVLNALPWIDAVAVPVVRHLMLCGSLMPARSKRQPRRV